MPSCGKTVLKVYTIRTRSQLISTLPSRPHPKSIKVSLVNLSHWNPRACEVGRDVPWVLLLHFSFPLWGSIVDMNISPSPLQPSLTSPIEQTAQMRKNFIHLPTLSEPFKSNIPPSANMADVIFQRQQARSNVSLKEKKMAPRIETWMMQIKGQLS